MYIHDLKLLGVFISDVRASGFRASGGLEPSKIIFGWAGGPRLGLDTSLACLSVAQCSTISKKC